MSKQYSIDSICTEIVREVTSDNSFEFEKKAEDKSTVELSEKFVKLPNNLNLKKIASEIREALKPVEVTYEDLNSFIAEVTR